MAKMQKPMLGCAFDPDQRNEQGRVEAYINELEHYRPRGFAKLRDEGRAMLRAEERNDRSVKRDEREYNDALEHASEWMTDCDNLLAEHANRYGLDHYCYGPFEHGGAIGYYVNIEGAKEDADMIVNDTGEVPKGFSGFVLQVSDHGNVTAYRYSRGKSREVWSVV